MPMKVFISGPMSGIEDYNRPAFLEAEKRLVAAGYSVFNPAWLLVDESWTRNDLMCIDISALTACDAIYQLPGWEKSEGAQVEYAYAIYTGKKILEKEETESMFLERPYEFDKEEQQIIYDALFHYQCYAEEMSKSNHFANDLFGGISDKTIALMRRLYEVWPDITH